MSTVGKHHAIVLGASGINGWSLVNQLLAGYPAPDTFSKVTVILNRPMSLQDSQWPQYEKESQEGRLQTVTGVNLLADDAAPMLQETLKTKIEGAETISHVYYAAYKQSDDVQEECQINKRMLQAAIRAVENVTETLTCVVLITGTKAYGLQMLDKFPYKDQVPLSESLPRVADDYAKDVFYYHQVDVLKQMSEGKPWTWCEVRPDVIVGIAPIGNAYCMAQTTGIYLSLFRFVEGPGSEVPFPGIPGAWTALSNDSNQDIIARFCIHASLHTNASGGKAFNIADSVHSYSWSTRWPSFAKYFGLIGVGPASPSPSSGQPPRPLHPVEYIKAHHSSLIQMCQDHNLKTDVVISSMNNKGAPMAILDVFDFDRTLDLSAARKLGFHEEIGLDESWYGAFERLKRARILPMIAS